MRLTSTTLMTLAALVLLPVAARADDPLATGKIIQVQAGATPGQSYALYLPRAYDAKRRWPILYCFDPGARGEIPVELYRQAAERHGWIVAGSNNSRNGPMAPIEVAMMAMWRDTRARLSIDDRRLYATGFSGGSYVAMVFAHSHPDYPFAGVFSCGAGMLPRGRAAGPDVGSELLSVGLVGGGDFAYAGVVRMRRELAALGAKHTRTLVFDGGHQWPPEPLAAAAVRYAELVATASAKPSTAAQRGRLAELGASERAAAEALLDGPGWWDGLARLRELHQLLDRAPAPEEPDPVTTAAAALAARIAELEADPRHAREQAAQKALAAAPLPERFTPATIGAAGDAWRSVLAEHRGTTAHRDAGLLVGWAIQACRQLAQRFQGQDPERAKAYADLADRLHR